MIARAETPVATALLGRLPRGVRAIGWLGILLGLLAFWVSLPPVVQRTPYWPVVLGALAVAAGVATAVGGERRLGGGAIASGVLGVAFGILATRSSVPHLHVVVVWSALIAAALVYATPLTFAAIGGLFSERSGVVNIGLEGMMLTGAFFGIWADAWSGSWVVGLLFAMLTGALLALIHAFFAIHLRADQIVSGTAVNFLALGITGYAFISIYGDNGTPANVSSIPDVTISTSNNFFAQAFGSLNLMIWLGIALVVLAWVVVFRTAIGLRIRAVGEHPRAADTAGLSVFGIRYACVTLSGALAALGGAYLSIGFVHSFNQNMTVGRGFIALAALIFGKWNPFGAFAAAFLFGFSSALADRLPPAYGNASGTLFNALPYVLTLIAVAGVIGRSIPPAAVGRPYRKQ